MVSNTSPVVASRTFAVPSSLIVAMRVPSGLNATVIVQEVSSAKVIWRCDACNNRTLAAKSIDLNSDLVYFGGFPEQNVGQLWKDIRGTGYTGKMMGSDRIKGEAFLEVAGADVAEGTYVTSSDVPFDQLTGKGADWYKNYKARFKAEPESYAVYGYESANVALAAINQVCEKNRARIRDAVFATKDFDGVLDTLSFDQNGDTTLLSMSGYQVKNGKFEFVQAIK